MAKVPRLLFFFSFLILLISSVSAVTISTFTDGTSSGNLTYLTGTEWYTKSFGILNNAIVTDAHIFLTGKNVSADSIINTTVYIVNQSKAYENATYCSAGMCTPVDTEYSNDARWDTASSINADMAHQFFWSGNFTKPQNSSGNIFEISSATIDYKINHSMAHFDPCVLYCYKTETVVQIIDDFVTLTYDSRTRKTIPAVCYNNSLLHIRIGAYCGYGNGKPYYYDFEVNMTYAHTILNQTYPTNVSLILNNATTVFNYGATNGSSLNHTVLANFTAYLSSPKGYLQNLSFRSNTTGIIEYSGLFITYFIPQRADFSKSIIRINGTNYTRNTDYILNLTCQIGDTTKVDIFLNGVWKEEKSISCIIQNNNYTGSITSAAEGNQTLTMYFNDTTDTSFNYYFFNDTFYWDLYNPTAVGWFTIPDIGYTSTVTWQCNDSAYHTLYYNYSFNNILMQKGNQTNSTILSNTGTLLPDSLNVVNGTCQDLFGSTYYSMSSFALLFNTLDYSRSNIIRVNGTNYTNLINYDANVTCIPEDTTYLNIFVNGVENKKESFVCTGVSQIVSGFVLSTTEGNKTLSFYLNDTTDTTHNRYGRNDTFFWDLYAPTVAISYSVNEGFGNLNASINLTCNDSAYSPLMYNMTVNGVTVFNANLSNLTIKNFNIALSNGVNTFVGKCSDLFYNTTLTSSYEYFMKLFWLVDEKTGLDFDVQNLSGVKLYLDDNSSYYDFKLANVTKVNYTSGESTKFRVELTYLNGDVVMRYIDISLTDYPNPPYPNNSIRVCANKEGITHYENILTSSRVRGVALKNVFAQCLVGMDYTRFAYQDNKILKTYTIPGNYNLYIYTDKYTRTLLASVDGSIASYIQIDVIEFSQTRTEISSGGEVLNFNPYGTNKVKIYYINVPNSSVSTRMRIWRMDTGNLLYDYTELVSPNEITYIFDYSFLVNVTNSTLFKAQVDRLDDDGNANTLKRYFTIRGASRTLLGKVGFVLALLLTVFGLTLSTTRHTFGWFGIIIIIASLGVLSFSVQDWYVIFLESVNVVLLMFIGVIMWKTDSLQVT